MTLKFRDLELDKLNNYFIFGHNYIIQTLCLKINEKFSVSEERFLWLNIGFNRMKDMFLSLQPEEGWYEKIKIDLNFYFKKCKNEPDDFIIKAHNEEIEKIGFLKDFYNEKQVYKIDKIYNIELYQQKGTADFNLKDKNLIKKIEKEEIRFNNFEEFNKVLNLLRKAEDIGYDLINKILEKKYYESFGVENLKKFLLCEENWKGVNQIVQKNLIDSVIKLKYQIDENEKEKVREFVLNYANNFYTYFNDSIKTGSENQLSDFLNTFRKENYYEILGYIKEAFEKPYYIDITEENLNKINEYIFYEIIEVLIKDIEKKYEKLNSKNKNIEFDFWNDEIFKFLWVLCILGFKRIYKELKKSNE